MMDHRSLTLPLILALSSLLGCGSSPISAQSTPSIRSEPVTPAAKAAPTAAAAPIASSASPSPAASPAAAARAQLGPGSPAIQLQQIVTLGDQRPVHLTHAGDGSGRLFVVEKQGRIRIVRNGAALPAPFLDISSLVNSSGGEQGLLSVAFHPDYETNGLLYVNYTGNSGIGDTVIARYQVSPDDPDRADPNTALTLLTIEQPYRNHNGGLVKFGPDGDLYVGMGDGGGGGDPRGNAQNRGTLLGKLLRIDVNGGQPYAIPADNPFVNEPGARPEIWSYGLRNPWRFSFDRATGDLYIADVGQNRYEWVHFQPAGQGGQNWGWDIVEGSHCFEPQQNCSPERFPKPIAEYDHSLGRSITGGYVYRGTSYPQLTGLYFYADYGSGRIWAAQQEASGTWHSEELLDSDLQISSFGEDESGELYLTSMGDNAVYRLTSP
jgi:glucose/arabinose dehydrogenase